MIIHGCHLPALARGDSRQFFTGIKWGWGRLKPKLSSCKRGNKYLVITAQSDWECQHVKQDDIMNSLTSQHFTESCNADCSSQKTVSVHWLPQSQAHMIMQQYRGRKFSLNTKIMHLRGWMIRCLPSGWGAERDRIKIVNLVRYLSSAHVMMHRIWKHFYTGQSNIFYDENCKAASSIWDFLS